LPLVTITATRRFTSSAASDIAAAVQAPHESGDAESVGAGRAAHQQADRRHRAPLRARGARREDGRGRGACHQRDECAAFHSITMQVVIAHSGVIASEAKQSP
jgi:hypothetical protein